MCRKERLRHQRKPSVQRRKPLFIGMEKKARPSADVIRQTWRRFFLKTVCIFFMIAVKVDEDALITFCISKQLTGTYRILYTCAVYTNTSCYLPSCVPISKTNPWSSASFQIAGDEARTIQSFQEEHWSWASSKCHALRRMFYNSFWNSDRL